MGLRHWVLAALLALAALPGPAAAQAASAAASVASPAAAAASSPPGLSNLPLQRDGRADANPGPSLLVQLMLAAGLLAVMAGLYKFRQKRSGQGGGATPALAAGQAVRLAQGVSLHTVSWGDEEILVACAAQGVTVLSRRARAADAGAQGGGQ